MNFYITGDTHRDFSRFYNKNFTKEDAIIILGDAGINYCLNINDNYLKKSLMNKCQAYFYCVRGNHEERPENIPTMTKLHDPIVKGVVYYEKAYPRIRYFIDGNTYFIDNKKTLVIGGAYSIDKEYRLKRNNGKIKGSGWFPQEQLSKSEQEKILSAVKGKEFELVLTHTCPLSVEPYDLFLNGIDQSSVDKSMEVFLEEINQNIKWGIWAFGHFHADRVERPQVEQYFTDIEPLDALWERWFCDIIESNINFYMLDKSPNYNDKTYCQSKK